MSIFNMFTKKEKPNNTTSKKVETEVLYSNKEQIEIIDGIELPSKWQTLSRTELISKAKTAIIALSKSSNPNFKAKELGFIDAEHLMKLCFDFILK